MPEVTDYTAILYYLDHNAARWNAITSTGTPVVVSYSFYDLAEIAAGGSGTAGLTPYTEADEAHIRDMLAVYEANAGVKFVEVEGTGMINFAGSDQRSGGGWADIAYSTEQRTGEGRLVNYYNDISEGSAGYETGLHEIGHAMGLSHSHHGGLELAEEFDHNAYTVMTYTYSSTPATDLGIFDKQALQHLYGATGVFDGWNISAGADDIITIEATDSDNVILGTAQTAIMRGLGGNDEIIGREADDLLDGGSGDDTLTGGRGQDELLGGAGNDRLIGDADLTPGSGHSSDADFLNGGTGDDELFGGNGRDTLEGGSGNDSLEGQDGSDFLYGGAGDDELQGGEGSDKLYGGEGRDRLEGGNSTDYLYGDAGRDWLSGGSGWDRMYGGDDNDTLEGGNGRDSLYGGGGTDDINGGADDDKIYGEDGSDFLIGGDGNDTMEGGSGGDILTGGNGDDRLIGGEGNDFMIGGNGADHFIFTAADNGADRISSFTCGEDKLDLSAMEGVSFGELDISGLGYATNVSFGGDLDVTLFGISALDSSDFLFA